MKFDYRAKLPEKLQNPIHALAFGFGSGLAKKAPGTFGTLAAVPIFLLLSLLPLWAYLIVVVAACTYGVHLCGKTADDMKVHDDPSIVWDEFAGFWITMIAIPVSFTTVVIGFALFRFFDILKPWPIDWIDRNVSGGLGIMLDDIVAGLMALGCLHLIHYFLL
ncbi:MAG: phosphatidylglycerophosphatase A [Pseudomonadales bacterium]|nr:phosphatidylglycerophosphatase A [Pseudomonadales bacterium]MCJ8338817.1 phosphatidylglycerophosphatase A [Pseudomonadales bacterium]NRA16053.1 phosphatidylglycerophosphatase A [Oceanospirillaceae bacterium]